MKKYFLCLVLFLVTAPLFGQDTLTKAAYLQAHAAVWENGKTKFEKVFTPGILNNQLILVGESHGTRSSYEFQYDLLVFLKQQTGFKYLLVELGYMDGLLLNDYLTNGDESKLQAFFSAHRGTFYWNQSVREFYHKLYRLNQSLPGAEKITLLPVDLEFGYRNALKFLQQDIFKGAASKSPVGAALLQIDALKDPAKEIISSYEKLYHDFVSQESTYKTMLDKQFEDTRFLMRNINERFDVATKGNADTRRDSVMMENIIAYKNRFSLDNQKIVGFLGSFHVLQKDKPQDIRLASLLKRSDVVNGVASVLLAYEGGSVMMPKYRSAAEIDSAKVLYKRVPNNFNYSLASMEDGELLKPWAGKSKGAMFDLSAKGSPFHTNKSFLMKSDQLGNTTEMYQVLVLINNSEATLPLEGEMQDSEK